MNNTRKELESTKKKLEEAEATITQLDVFKDKHLAAILEDRDRAWTQDYQPRIKELRQEVVRLEQENKDLLQSQYQSIDWEPDNDNIVRKGARFDHFDLTRHNQQVFENLRAAYERLQQAHTALWAKQEARGE